MVLHPLRLTQHRIEMLCVEITVIDLVAPRSQSCDDLAMQPRAEAASDWIGIENKNTQRTAPIIFAPDLVSPPRPRCHRMSEEADPLVRIAPN